MTRPASLRLSPALRNALWDVFEDRAPAIPSARRLLAMGLVERKGQQGGVEGIIEWLCGSLHRSPYVLTRAGALELELERLAHAAPKHAPGGPYLQNAREMCLAGGGGQYNYGLHDDGDRHKELAHALTDAVRGELWRLLGPAAEEVDLREVGDALLRGCS